MGKRVFTMLFSLLFLIACAGCQNKPDFWSDVSTLPYSGYLCVQEDSSIQISLPLFSPYSGKDDKELTHVIFSAEGDPSIECKEYSLTDESSSNVPGYFTRTLFADIPVGESSTYVLNQLDLLFSDGTSFTQSLAPFSFDIRAAQQNVLKLRSYTIAIGEYSRFKATYLNTGNEAVTLESITLDPQKYDGIEKILSAASMDAFDQGEYTEDASLQPGEEKFFVFELKQNNAYFSENERPYYFYLPFVTYRMGGQSFTVPAQKAPTQYEYPYRLQDFISS